MVYHSTLGLRVMKKKKRADRIGLVCKAPRLLHHATLGVRVTKKTEKRVNRSDMKRFRGGLVCKAHRRVHHSTLGLRVIKKQKNRYLCLRAETGVPRSCETAPP